MTRMVVDSNYLQIDALEAYLSVSPSNMAVLTDYAAMEAYKGDTLKSIYKSMAVLAKHPSQVIVLKGTQALRGLAGRAAAKPKSLIDVVQTREFSEYCHALSAAQRGNLSGENEILALGRSATDHMNALLQDMPTLSTGFELVRNTYTSRELKQLRERDFSSLVLREKLIQNVTGLARQLFEDHLLLAQRPKGAHMRDAFLFRYALFTHALIIVSSVGTVKTNPTELRNDMVDVNFATVASYFDGLFSKDSGATRTYEYGSLLLRDIFALPPWWLRALITVFRMNRF